MAEYEFYMDVFFLTDLYLNLLALYLAACMGRRAIGWCRLFLAAALGSLASCLLLLFPLWPVFTEVVMTVFLVGSLMNRIAFSVKDFGGFIKADGLLFLASALLGGLFELLKEVCFLADGEALLFLAGTTALSGYGFSGLMRGKARGQERYPVRLYYGGRMREFVALVDSGNRLRAPGSGAPVSIVSRKDCEGFLDRVSGVLMIPYRAVGTERGMMPGIVAEKMEIEEEDRILVVERPVVAVAKEPLSGRGDFSMLLPEAFLYPEE